MRLGEAGQVSIPLNFINFMKVSEVRKYFVIILAAMLILLHGTKISLLVIISIVKQ